LPQELLEPLFDGQIRRRGRCRCRSVAGVSEVVGVVNLRCVEA
jgi:hypothetical protein